LAVVALAGSAAPMLPLAADQVVAVAALEGMMLSSS